MTREIEDEQERPIVFVGHSLGGLVIKEALLRSSEYYHNQQDEELGSVFACTKGIVFLGTPHRGSTLTPYGQIVAKIAKLALQNPNDKLLQLLESESPIMERQRKSFASISKDIGLAYVVEELPTALGIVVPEWSASIDGFNVKSHIVPANHMDMCKFSKREDVGYKRVVFLIKNILKQEYRARQQMLANVTTNLLLSLVFESMDSREEGIDIAHRNTFSWLMEPERTEPPESSSFLDWLKTEEPIFWLSGKAGSGKSTLMKFIATHDSLSRRLEEAFPEKRWVVASHYLFERGKDSLQKSREGLIRHLLYQLISKEPELARTVLKQQNASRAFNENKPWSWRELENSFDKILADKPPNLQVLCFIDGLDEYRPVEKVGTFDSSDEENEDLTQEDTISDGHQEISDLVIDVSKYKNVKFCVSSRPLLVIRDKFKRYTHMQLDTLTRDDISRYVNDRLKGNEILSQLSIFTPSFADDVIKEILSKASGVFLWVRLVLDIILGGLRARDTPPQLLQKLRGMPSDLGGRKGLYMKMLRNLPRDNLRDGYKYFQMLLTAKHEIDTLLLSFIMDEPAAVFAAPMRAMNEEELRIRREHTKDRVLSRCGGLLEVSQELPKTIRLDFIHQTAKEFVENPNNWKLIFPAAESVQFDGCLALLQASVMMLKHAQPLHVQSGRADRFETRRKLERCLDYARECEKTSGAANVDLIFLVDRIMLNLYRPRELVDKPTEFLQLVGDLHRLDLNDMISRFKQTRSNTISPIHPCHWSVMNPGVSFVPRCQDLMAVAIQSNLSMFLDSLKKGGLLEALAEREYPLLAYALVPYRIRYSTVEDQYFYLEDTEPRFLASDTHRTEKTQSISDVTRILLDSGQDPNESYMGPAYHPACTIWQGFLAYGELIEDPDAESEEFPREHYKIWFENAQVLLDRDVDVNVTCYVRNPKLPQAPSELQYPQRSALFIVVILLWRTAKARGLHKDVLQKMAEKGALLRRGEMQELLEVATQLSVPNTFVMDVTGLISESDALDETVFQSDTQSSAVDVASSQITDADVTTDQPLNLPVLRDSQQPGQSSIMVPQNFPSAPPDTSIAEGSYSTRGRGAHINRRREVTIKKRRLSRKLYFLDADGKRRYTSESEWRRIDGGYELIVQDDVYFTRRFP
ncbi:hypothetical protein GGR54DRAFT_622131 [Hypoxylon sp. NC1633]|nr:hypothetical protein GGR54DRAFT_622131 [Hypoxylon sp. NC1633]